MNQTCKGEDEIKDLLDILVLNQIKIQEGIDFQNEEYYHKNPIRADLVFFK